MSAVIQRDSSPKSQCMENEHDVLKEVTIKSESKHNISVAQHALASVQMLTFQPTQYIFACHARLAGASTICKMLWLNLFIRVQLTLTQVQNN